MTAQPYEDQRAGEPPSIPAIVGKPSPAPDKKHAFYRDRDDKRRWVIFNGEPEASRISPQWHGWLHHTFDENPAANPLPNKAWEKPHQDNLTGTALAYAPAGSMRQAQPADRRDYEAWQPE